MNKIKLMYDIITIMQDKKEVNGNVKMEATRDEVKIFDFENEFEKNFATGQVKAKIRTEVNLGGRKLKHESTTELAAQEFPNRLHSITDSIPYRHPHPIPGRCQGRLSRMALFLKILDDLQVEELADGSVQISLELQEWPEYLRTCMQTERDRYIMMRLHGQPIFREMLTVDHPQLSLHARIKPNREMERVVLVIGGDQLREGGEPHVMNLRIECKLCS